MKLNSVIVNQVKLEYFKWKKSTPWVYRLQVARKRDYINIKMKAREILNFTMTKKWRFKNSIVLKIY